MNETVFGLSCVGADRELDSAFYSGRTELLVGLDYRCTIVGVDYCGNMAGHQAVTLLNSEQGSGGYSAVIQGPQGVIEIHQLVWIDDRQDILEILYWQSWAVLNGAYHCCLSVPGKVALLQP